MKIDLKPLSLAEVDEIVISEENSDLKGFIKKFLKIDKKKAEELRKELEGLDMLKLKEEHIVKIIDFLPEDVEDINKIFTDVSLNEDETKKIIEIVARYR